MSEGLTQTDGRLWHLKRATALTLFTVSWNVVEGVIAVTAAIGAGSVALLGFGVDSFVESSSGGVSLFALAAYIAWDAVMALLTGERPQPSMVGIALTSLSLLVMMWLARGKRRTAVALGSRAMEADAFQTTACWWLSMVTLSGIGLNAAFGWWWADPVAALGMTFFLVKEAEGTSHESKTARGLRDGTAQGA